MTTHAGVWGATNDDGIRLMHENGFATPETVYVHAATLNEDSYLRIAASGGSISVSTESEQSAGQGYPPTWQVRRYDIPVSLSMDTSVWWSGDLFSAMRTTLGADRAREHLEAHVAGETVTSAHLRAEHVVDWATRGGAQALKRDDLGSLEVGQEGRPGADQERPLTGVVPAAQPVRARGVPGPAGRRAHGDHRRPDRQATTTGWSGSTWPRPAAPWRATVDYLRSEMGEEVWQAGMHPDLPARRQGARQPVHLHRLPHRGDPRGAGVDLRRVGVEPEAWPDAAPDPTSSRPWPAGSTCWPASTPAGRR